MFLAQILHVENKKESMFLYEFTFFFFCGGGGGQHFVSDFCVFICDDDEYFFIVEIHSEILQNDH